MADTDKNTDGSAGAVRGLSALLKSTDPQEALDAARALLPNPIMLTDATHRLIAVTEEPELRSNVWLEIIENGGVPLAWTFQPQIVAAYQTSREEGRTVLDEESTPNSQMLRRALTIHGRLIGFLDSPGHYRPFSEEDIALFDLLAELCTLLLAGGREFGELPENMLEFFISDLISGRMRDPLLIDERARHFRWTVFAEMRLITLRLEADRFSAQGATRLQHACERVQAAFPGATAFTFSRDIKLLAPHPLPDSDELYALLQENALYAGVSRVFSELSEFAARDMESLSALRSGWVLHPEARVYLYDVYAPYHLFNRPDVAEDLHVYCHSAVLSLVEDDRRRGSAMGLTLKCYLECHGNTATVAQRLGLHRNTVHHRLGRIRELYGIDADDPQSVASVLLSLCILEYEDALFRETRPAPYRE